jgi:hypothetical protein
MVMGISGLSGDGKDYAPRLEARPWGRNGDG